MFERFTDRARRVVVLAQEEARMLEHGYIGTEHLLLGLIHEGDGVAAKALEAMEIDLDTVRRQVEAIIGRGEHPQSGHIPFTPRAKRVLELSLHESDQLGHRYIGTEHILLGLVREGDGVAAQVLVKLGADLNNVRQEVIQQLHGRTVENPGEGGIWRRARGARAGAIEDVLARFDAIDLRLAAIERWVGMGPDVRDAEAEIAQLRRDKESAIDAQDFETAAALRDREKRLLHDKDRKEKSWAADTGDGLSLAEDFGRLSAELDRLRAILRDHDIEPEAGGAEHG
jgi:Clp amino terminal domain, pathogenicity island component/UvrB/uvrC motif